MDYRPIPPDREEQFKEYLQYAFSPEEGRDADRDWEVDAQPSAPRGLFDGDELRCVCRHNWFRTRIRGRWFEMAGLSSVASPPEHRRQGHVTRLLAESLAEYRDRGDHLAALWAFKHSFYERHGWGLATTFRRYECNPAALAFAREDAAGSFRPVEPDEFELLDPVLAAAGEDYELAVDRTERWWRKRVFESGQTDPYVYVWERDGDVRGHVVYRIDDRGDDKLLHALELAAADPAARRNLLRFLADHDSQVDRIRLYGPPDDRLLDLAPNPGEIDCEVLPGPMVRLVDVPAAVEALEYPNAPDASFVLSVDDSLADWNDRRFRIAVEGGAASCDPTDAEPDARVGVAALSQVYVGYHSVEAAEAIGSLGIESPAAREALSGMFPERTVFLREHF